MGDADFMSEYLEFSIILDNNEMLEDLCGKRKGKWREEESIKEEWRKVGRYKFRNSQDKA